MDPLEYSTGFHYIHTGTHWEKAQVPRGMHNQERGLPSGILKDQFQVQNARGGWNFHVKRTKEGFPIRIFYQFL